MHALRSALVLLAFFSTAPDATAITLGQTDDFQDGTVMNWAHGALSPEPPSVRTGGREGANDVYLRNVSTGAGREASRMILFNTSQWAGDYLGAGVHVIRAHMINLGNEPLRMRVAMQDTALVGVPGRIASRHPVELPADGQWHALEFRLNSDDMVILSGGLSVEQVLRGVSTLRILSSAEPAWIGDSIAGELGLDNIEAAAATAVESTTWSEIKASYQAR